MEKKPLGKTGEKIAAIGLGTWGIGGFSTPDHSRDSMAIEAIRYAVELGMTHIDTAEVYGGGHSEELVGKALNNYPRDELFIATKVWHTHLHYQDVLKACSGSLQRLGMGYIDLYMIHWPNPRTPIDETMRAMEKLVQDGCIRYIGVSNFDVKLLTEAMKALKKEDIVANQVEYSLEAREVEKELIPFCERNGITITAYTPLGKGRIPAETNTQRGRTLSEIAKQYGKTPTQVALNWVIWRPNTITIPKAIRKEHLDENAGAAGWRLSEEDYKRLSTAYS